MLKVIIKTILLAKIDILSSSRMYFQVDYRIPYYYYRFVLSSFHLAILTKPLCHDDKSSISFEVFLLVLLSKKPYSNIAMASLSIEWLAAFSFV